MLSAVILSRHSYGAVHLVVQPPDQRSVHFGPLVVHSPLSWSTDYIFTRSAEGRTRAVASYPYEQSVSRTDSSTYESYTLCTVVTGSNVKHDSIPLSSECSRSSNSPFL